MPPLNINWFSEAKSVQVAKISIERYFIRKMKIGSSEPFCEKSILKMLGIEKLQYAASVEACPAVELAPLRPSKMAEGSGEFLIRAHRFL
jgi:hypothetical protein